jgi:protein-tyrosine-phosphatase
MSVATKQTMASRIRKMRSDNPQMTANQIAEALGTKVSYIYTLAYSDRKSGKKVKRLKILRPRIKSEKVSNAIPKGNGTSLEQEIVSLKAVIRYLESRVYGASV